MAGPPYKLTHQVQRQEALPLELLERTLPSLHLKMLHGVEPSPTALCAACVFHCGAPTTRQVPCMVKVGADGSGTSFQVTVATADPQTSAALQMHLVQLISML